MIIMKYDYLIVGSGLFGSVFAYEMTKKGKTWKVISADKNLQNLMTADAIKSGEEVRKMLEIASKELESAGYVPYYLYRQKHMAGNFENVGYAKLGKAGIYNILIMEEKQSIVALGAGSVTKRVKPDGVIERASNVKSVEQYLDRVDEMIERKKVLFAD